LLQRNMHQARPNARLSSMLITQHTERRDRMLQRADRPTPGHNRSIFPRPRRAKVRYLLVSEHFDADVRGF
jgi:hypothetical protein